MSEGICGEGLTTKEGICKASKFNQDDELKFPDGKCGRHTSHKKTNDAPKAENDLIQEFIDSQKGKVKASTWSSQRAACLAFDEYLQERGENDPESLSPLFLEDWVSWLMDPNGRGLAESSTMDYGNSLSVFYNWIIKRQKGNGGDTIENPLKESDWRDQLETGGTPEKEKVLGNREDYFAPSKKQVETLIDHAQPPDRFRSQLIMKMLAQTGARPHELRKIKISDVRNSDSTELWENNRIVIHSSKTERYSGDRSGTRTVRYQDSLKFYLKKWLEGYRDSYYYAEESPYLFPSNNSEKISKSVIDRTVKNAAEEAGIQEVLWVDANGKKRHKFTPYCLRHFYASQMASELQPSELAQLMGSSVDTVTKYYVEIREDKLDKASEVTPDV